MSCTALRWNSSKNYTQVPVLHCTQGRFLQKSYTGPCPALHLGGIPPKNIHRSLSCTAHRWNSSKNYTQVPVLHCTYVGFLQKSYTGICPAVHSGGIPPKLYRGPCPALHSGGIPPKIIHRPLSCTALRWDSSKNHIQASVLHCTQGDSSKNHTQASVLHCTQVKFLQK